MVELSTFKNFGQIGIVVKDMDKAIEGLQSLGIGPFGPLVGAAPCVRFEERGKPADIKLKMRFTKIGPVEL